MRIRKKDRTLDETTVVEETNDRPDRVDDVDPRPVDEAVVERRDTTDEDTQLSLDPVPAVDETDEHVETEHVETAEPVEVVELDEPADTAETSVTQVVEPTPAAPVVADESPAEQTTIETVEPIRDRTAEREERNRALGVVTRTEETTPVVAPVAPVRRTTDRWHGSLGLFLLRLVTGGMLLVHGVQHLMHLTATRDYFSHSILPSPQYFALGASIAECVIGALLVLGLMTRLAGLLLTVLGVGYLVFFIWGKVNPFDGRTLGFNGELELLWSVIGLLFLLLGGGGWAIDRILRRNRARKKEARALGQI